MIKKAKGVKKTKNYKVGLKIQTGSTAAYRQLLVFNISPVTSQDVMACHYNSAYEVRKIQKCSQAPNIFILHSGPTSMHAKKRKSIRIARHIRSYRSRDITMYNFCFTLSAGLHNLWPSWAFAIAENVATAWLLIYNYLSRFSFKLQQNEIESVSRGKFMLVNLALRAFWVVPACLSESSSSRMRNTGPVCHCHAVLI